MKAPKKTAKDWTPNPTIKAGPEVDLSPPERPADQPPPRKPEPVEPSKGPWLVEEDTATYGGFRLRSGVAAVVYFPSGDVGHEQARANAKFVAALVEDFYKRQQKG